MNFCLLDNKIVMIGFSLDMGFYKQLNVLYNLLINVIEWNKLGTFFKFDS